MSIQRWGLEERSSPRSTNSLRRKVSREFKTLPISVHGMEARAGTAPACRTITVFAARQ